MSVGKNPATQGNLTWGKKSWLGKNTRKHNFPLHHLVRNFDIYFISDVLGCLRVAAFSPAVVARNWNLGYPKIVTFYFYS